MEDLSLSIRLFRELFSWRNALDIFLIFLLMFLGYRTFLRLGAWKIMVGILLAVAVFVAADFLELTGIKWIYSNVSHVAVIALIIIFQPELRKMFERAASLRRTQGVKRGSDLSAMVSKALFALSGQKRGAIIVLPGREPVSRWIKGGYSLNAEPSYPLLMSIFDPNSPGHDGAVIIRGEKISHFGVRLPVSQTSNLTEDYGTRHHAAMGLAEVTDALILLVSEERGRVMIFHQGDMRQASNPENLKETISSHRHITGMLLPDTPGGLRAWVLAPQVIISAVLAVSIWSALNIAKAEIRQRVLSVPVEYASAPGNLILVGDKVSEVKLYLGGPKPELDALTPSQLSIKVDLSKAMAGKQNFIITHENIKLPRNIRLLDAVPPNLTLDLAAISEQEIPVKPQLVGKLAEGLKLKSVNVKPEKVRALLPGAEGRANTFNLTTTPIYLETLFETTTIFCKIIAPPSVQPVDKRWPDVAVNLEIGP